MEIQIKDTIEQIKEITHENDASFLIMVNIFADYYKKDTKKMNEFIRILKKKGLIGFDIYKQYEIHKDYSKFIVNITM
jgi:hypothetical protein